MFIYYIHTDKGKLDISDKSFDDILNIIEDLKLELENSPNNSNSYIKLYLQDDVIMEGNELNLILYIVINEDNKWVAVDHSFSQWYIRTYHKAFRSIDYPLANMRSLMNKYMLYCITMNVEPVWDK